MTSGADVAARVLAGDQRAVARVITLIEDGAPVVDEIMATLFSHTGRADVVGVTGPPGAGKSTLVGRMVAVWRAAGRSVGVLAVDPSSPFTGGAILADRIRMSALAGDPGVYIRSMAGRSQLGGLAEATPAAVRVLDALGTDVIVIETVGVGQSEVAVAGAVDCTVLATMPGGGDGIQAMKAGVMEIGDVFVVNKADREGAVRTRREIEVMLRTQDVGSRPPVLMTTADTGAGVPELVAAVDSFIAGRRASGALERRRQRHLQQEALELIGARARRQALAALDPAMVEELSAALRERTQDPTQVAARALAVAGVAR